MNLIQRVASSIASAFRGGSPSVRAAYGSGSQQYDTARTDDENYRHWAHADSRNANAQNDPGTRHTLRNRSRYEAANNSYYAGLLNTLANDLIGTGPKLQLTLPAEAPADAARKVEFRFGGWQAESDQADKLRVIEKTSIRDGEGFGLAINNPKFQDVKLDYRLYEADQIATPFLYPYDPLAFDGMRIDEQGNPAQFHFLKVHPGSPVLPWLALSGEYIDADQVLHWYRPDRPGQLRGVPELTPALDLFAQLRRYTKAVLSSAELAACIAGVMKTNLPADAVGSGMGEGSPKLFDPMHLVRNALLTVPDGWAPDKFENGQPMATFGDFRAEILNEIARCLDVPFNVISLNSSRYNYSSGRLDYLIYHRNIRVKRMRMVHRVLNLMLRHWVHEASLLPGYLPAGLPPISTWRWAWYWDGFESIDPQKEAQASQAMLACNLTTLAEEYAQQGKDWEVELRQRAREVALAKQLGIEAVLPPAPKSESTVDAEPVAQPQPPTPAPAPQRRAKARFARARYGSRVTIGRPI